MRILQISPLSTFARLRYCQKRIGVRSVVPEDPPLDASEAVMSVAALVWRAVHEVVFKMWRGVGGEFLGQKELWQSRLWRAR